MDGVKFIHVIMKVIHNLVESWDNSGNGVIGFLIGMNWV